MKFSARISLGCNLRKDAFPGPIAGHFVRGVQGVHFARHLPMFILDPQTDFSRQGGSIELPDLHLALFLFQTAARLATELREPSPPGHEQNGKQA